MLIIQNNEKVLNLAACIWAILEGLLISRLQSEVLSIQNFSRLFTDKVSQNTEILAGQVFHVNFLAKVCISAFLFEVSLAGVNSEHFLAADNISLLHQDALRNK